MKYFLTGSLLLCSYMLLHAQSKYDYTWLMGYKPDWPHPKIGGSIIDFNGATPDTAKFEIPFSFRAISMISDPNDGSILFYSNGCQVANKLHQIMENGDGLNPGTISNTYCESGYPISQGLTTLPFPGSTHKFIVIQYQYNYPDDFFINILYSVIDMENDNGLGKVVEKNTPLLNNRTLLTGLTAVRHGNGRDWWIVAPMCQSNEIYLFLLTPDGFQAPIIRNIGPAWDDHYYLAHATFSPDGSKYIRASPWNGLHITNFNRCDGTFSNLKYEPLADDVGLCGVAVSPNSRFLYLSTGTKLWQYDLSKSNVVNTEILIGEYDGFVSPFSTTFYQPMLAPDGKIYMTSTNGVDVLHVIHQPNLLGIACQFEQHGLFIPTYHAAVIPNFPHFRLYDWADSPCDTLGIDGETVGVSPEPNPADGLSLQPIPATSTLLISSEPGVQYDNWTLVNSLGTSIQTGAWPNESAQLHLDVSALPNGLYFFSLQQHTGRPLTAKVVVKH